jgi:excisionase family DNA binding protein
VSGKLELSLAELIEQLATTLAQRLTENEPHQPTSSTDSPWLNIENAAAYLDWPKQRLYKLTASGGIPHYKQDGRLLFHRAELDGWVREHAQPQQPASQ